MRLISLFFGLALCSAAIVSELESHLGLPPWDVLHQGVSRHTPLEIGQANVVVALVMLVVAWSLGQPPGFGTVANAIVIGTLVDVFLAIGWVHGLGGASLGVRVALLVAGIALFGVGSAFYIGAAFGAGPRDSTMLALSRRTGRRIAVVRGSIELAALAIGWTLGGTVGIGTAAAALLVGPAVEGSVLARRPARPRAPRPDGARGVPDGARRRRLRGTVSSTTATRASLQRRALRLEYATITWNVGEAVFTITLGVMAGSLALIGFGLDSLIEIFASLVVIWHVRPAHAVDRPERTRLALRLVAWAFVALAIVLSIAAVRDLVLGRQAGESPLGMAYVGATAVVMFGLAFAKRSTAGRLDSAPLRSEAALTFLDGTLATLTLIGLALNAVLGWRWADPGAALVVAIAAAVEARENWTEASELTARSPAG